MLTFNFKVDTFGEERQIQQKNWKEVHSREINGVPSCISLLINVLYFLFLNICNGETHTQYTPILHRVLMLLLYLSQVIRDISGVKQKMQTFSKHFKTSSV